MNKRVSLIQKSILGFQDVVILLSKCLPAEDRVWWKPYDVHFIRLASTASFDPTAWTSFRIPKLEDDGGSRVGASKLFCIWLLGFLSVAAQTLQQQKHPIHSEVQKKFGFPTELLVDVVCVTCSAHAFVVATHATHHLPLLLKFLKNIEGKPQTNTEKREEKHKLQDQRAKAAEVKEGQIEPPTRTSTHRQNSEPMNNPH